MEECCGKVEQIGNRVVDGDETLQTFRRSETLHCPFSFRSGTREFSALLFNPLCERCSTCGIT
jgi:hypothetical protein